MALPIILSTSSLLSTEIAKITSVLPEVSTISYLVKELKNFSTNSIATTHAAFPLVN